MEAHRHRRRFCGHGGQSSGGTPRKLATQPRCLQPWLNLGTMRVPFSLLHRAGAREWSSTVPDSDRQSVRTLSRLSATTCASAAPGWWGGHAGPCGARLAGRCVRIDRRIGERKLRGRGNPCPTSDLVQAPVTRIQLARFATPADDTFTKIRCARCELRRSMAPGSVAVSAGYRNRSRGSDFAEYQAVGRRESSMRARIRLHHVVELHECGSMPTGIDHRSRCSWTAREVASRKGAP